MVLIEYNEMRGTFHHNRVCVESKLQGGKVVYILKVLGEKPDADGWSSIATTTDDRAYLFCCMMDCRNQWRKKDCMRPMSVEELKREWALFCYQINHMLQQPLQNEDAWDEVIKVTFDSSKALCMLGHPGFRQFVVVREAWNYSPLDFKDSNFI